MFRTKQLKLSAIAAIALTGAIGSLGGGLHLNLATAATPCPWDCADANGNVGVVDLLALLEQWGQPGPCDFDNGGVAVTDFLALLANWDECP